MAEFKTGDKVRYEGTVMPAEVLSGPHASHGKERYLILKADGNVLFVPATDIVRVVPRLDQVAGALAMDVYGRLFVSLDRQRQIQITRAATTVLAIADRTRGEA